MTTSAMTRIMLREYLAGTLEQDLGMEDVEAPEVMSTMSMVVWGMPAEALAIEVCLWRATYASGFYSREESYEY